MPIELLASWVESGKMTLRMLNPLLFLFLTFSGGITLLADAPEIKQGTVDPGVWLLYQRALNQDAEAQYELAWLYVDGERGLPRDDGAAFHWFNESALAGYGPSFIEVGYCYSQGVGVEQNVQEAYDWYIKSADEGDAIAMSDLGYMYAAGKLGQIDFKSASDWFHRALIGENILARNNAAWYFATVEDKRHVRGKYAVEIMIGVVKEDPHHNFFDTFAAALAANGQFGNAQQAQKQAIRQANLLAEYDVIEGYNERLVLYENRQRFIYFGVDGVTE